MSVVQPPGPIAGGPSDTARTVVSFLLFLHLFAVGVGVISRANVATPAPLETRLRQVPGVEPYIALTGLDWSYTYYLLLTRPVSDRPSWDLRVEVELQLPTGTSETFVFPDAKQMHGPQFHRYERLVAIAAEHLEAPGAESRIPEGIARGLVRERGATGGTIRIRGKTIPQQEFDPFPSDYPAAPLYEARILVAGDTVSLFKLDSATDSAPASRGSGQPPRSTPPSNGAPSGS